MSALAREDILWGRSTGGVSSWHAYTGRAGDYLCGTPKTSHQMSDSQPDAACLRCIYEASLLTTEQDEREVWPEVSDLPREGIRWGQNTDEVVLWHAYTNRFDNYLCDAQKTSHRMSDSQPETVCAPCLFETLHLMAVAKSPLRTLSRALMEKM